MIENPLIIALRGRENFKLIKPIWFLPDSRPLRLQILSDWEETTQLARAQAFCEAPGEGFPPIKDETLKDHTEQAFLLWYALRDPDKVYPGTEEHVRIFESAGDLQKALSAEQLQWLSREYAAFRKASSPFKTAINAGQESYEKLLEQISKSVNDGLKIERYKLWFCVTQGILPTEARFKEMTFEQWALLMSVTPHQKLLEVFPEQAPEKIQPLVDAPVDG